MLRNRRNGDQDRRENALNPSPWEVVQLSAQFTRPSLSPWEAVIFLNVKKVRITLSVMLPQKTKGF